MSHKTSNWFEEYRTRPSRSQLLQLAVLGGIVLIQVAVYYLVPRGMQVSLALNHQDPEILSWFTHAYVHRHGPGDQHLWSNMTLYLVAVIPLWVLHEMENRRQQFWMSVTVLLVIVPPVSLLVSELVYEGILGATMQYSRGFSGVATSLAGFLLTSTLGIFDRHQHPKLRYLTVGGIVVFLLAALAWTINMSPIPVVFGGLAIVGTVVLLGLWKIGYVAGANEISTWVKQNAALSLVAYCGIAVAVLAIKSVAPDTFIQNGSFINFVAHGVGFVIGLFLPQLIDWAHLKNSGTTSTENL